MATLQKIKASELLARRPRELTDDEQRVRAAVLKAREQHRHMESMSADCDRMQAKLQRAETRLGEMTERSTDDMEAAQELAEQLIGGTIQWTE